jgi:hypothetical protein
MATPAWAAYTMPLRNKLEEKNAKRDQTENQKATSRKEEEALKWWAGTEPRTSAQCACRHHNL